MDVPIYFNGIKVNTPPSECKWDIEDENAWYSFGVGTDLKIYNLGAFTMGMSATQMGTMGIIVSKKQLKVNFARNDIQHDCPIYTAIQKIIQENRVKKRRKSNRINNEHERTALLYDLVAGDEDYNEVKNIGLFRTTSDKLFTLEQVRKNRMPWSFAEQGDIRADRLMQSETAIVFNSKVLGEVSYQGEECDFFTWVAKRSDYASAYNSYGGDRYVEEKWGMHARMYGKFNDLTQGISGICKILPTNKLTVVEKRVLSILEKHNRYWGGRTLCIGSSDTYDGWTDGKSYIAIAREFLKRICVERDYNTHRLVALLCHEMAHNDDDTGSHIHGEEFYRRFHDLVMGQYDSPMQIVSSIANDIQRSKLDEKKQKELQKQIKAEKKQREKLGVPTQAS
jgi:hypothetical protein